MKIIFAGTPDFAVPALTALIEAGHQIVMVLTQPDRPAGRGMKLKASPVKVLAEQHHLSVYQPETLKDAAVQAHIEAINADVMIVAAYGLIIPTVVLNMPRFGCYNIHASLLPRWRGAAPIHRSILAGDAETGVTIMEVAPALDAGAMISRGEVRIAESDTTQTLHDALSNIGAELMVQAMATLEEQGTLPAKQQDEALVTYAHKLDKSEAAIDWHKSAIEVSRQVRAFNPFPVAQGTLKHEVCRIWMATAKAGKARAGEIVSVHDGVTVGCGEGLLHITELQAPGGKRLSAQAFVQGHNLQIGDFFT
ncbi:methionyl-tRNA formyltransferase [Methylotenera sp.]|uniref:methionyl-tRNA formyltransferase n=1 Tax=Methylotenera sp. TaxID=2051956 RepID=UPI00272F29C6|nr:methionyl-tRNA formyltransferase [Methylotenera sp.]MDP2070343.1 methionyl-tRNA formyltransferase [Methylotenera sp.]MDP3004558.1 methionyl-tRNA formyltransferase [Methylotenera sp.]